MKTINFLFITCLLSGCAEPENIFFSDEKCDGVPTLFERYVVDIDRQTVLLQIGEVYGNDIKETGAMYLDSCKVNDTKNFVCMVEPNLYSISLSKGTLIKKDKSNPWKTEDCLYKKTIFGYKKIDFVSTSQATRLIN